MAKIGCGSAKANLKNCVFRLLLRSPFTIFVVVLDNLFDYQLFVENSHENGQRIRKCGTVW